MAEKPRQISEEDWEEWTGNRITETFFEWLKDVYGDMEKEMVLASSGFASNQKAMFNFSIYVIENRTSREILNEVIEITGEKINEYFS